MTLYTASTLTRSPATDKSYAYTDQGTITLTPATGDVANFFVIPAGTEIREVVINNADLGTAAPFDIGFAPLDGSAGNATAFASAYAGGTAVSAGQPYHVILASPVKVERDSFLQAVFGTVSSGASGAVTLQAKGILLGAK
jgi:hypothetical protein